MTLSITLQTSTEDVPGICGRITSPSIPTAKSCAPSSLRFRLRVMGVVTCKRMFDNEEKNG
jgi:hypothetical protein